MKPEPVRLQRHRYKGFKLKSPNGLPIVYVGRPSKWGNPYKIGEVYMTRDKKGNAAGYKKIKDIGTLMEAYEQYIRDRLWAKDLGHDIKELKGKNLACWCKPYELCHADILLKIAND